MIVQCPYCATRYEIEAARLTGPTPMLKCSKCRHIFPAPASKKPAAPAPPPASKPAESDEKNLKLPFEEGRWKDEAEPEPAEDLTVNEPEEPFTLGTESAAEELKVPPVQPEPDVTATPASMPTLAEEEDEDEDEVDVELERNEPEIEIRPRRSRRRRDRDRGNDRGKMWALYTFLALVVASYGLLTRALFASPALCDRLLGRLPVIGTLGDERLLTRKVALSEVVGNYQRIKDGKEVFVITGRAMNTAPVPLHGVQLLGKLYNPGGTLLDQKTIYCGNVISAKVLKDLTPQELSILQKLNPPKRFVIEPGDASTFVIIFMDPPRDAVEFSAQVVAAQRQA